MNYIYHWVPEDMQGDTLYPLNILKDLHPDLYATEALKYTGRERVMQQQIPILNCLWNDVIHFSPIHPWIIKQALIDAGRTKSFTTSFFEIDPHLLTPENTIVYLHKHTDKTHKMTEENFAKFDPDNVGQYAELPQVTKDYYKEMYGKGERPLLFVGVPHILYKGSINTNEIKRISL
ncbi:MAG: hypothetical protein V4519_02420 [Patescibacteria group bacterium]